MHARCGWVYEFGPFRLEHAERRLLRQGTPIVLTPKALDLLIVLVERAGHLVSKEELLREVWPDSFVEEANLSVNISALRRAIGDEHHDRGKYIETIPKVGYRFVAPVRELAESEAEPASTGSSSAGGRRKSSAPLVASEEAATPSAPILLRPVSYVHWLLIAIGLALIVFVGVAAWRIERARRTLAHQAPVIRSIAVLPLANLSGDPAQEYFADGVTEELITDLSKIGALRVISRTSVMHYKGTQKTVPEIARELKVDAVLAGSVAHSGNRVRITAQLIRASAETPLWAENFERDVKDVLALQDEVSRDIANQIQVKLTPQEEARLTSARSVDPEAHEFYVKGRYYWEKRTPETLNKSLEYFQRAVEKDPRYALGYAGLADAYAMLAAGAYSVLSPKEAYPKAEAAAMKALQLDSTLAEAHTTLGWSKFIFDWEWQAAEREFKRAIELNPGYANAHHWYASFLSAMGRFPEAIAEDREAESLDPLSLVISADVATEALAPAGMYDEAIRQCRKTLEMDPNFVLAHACLADSYDRKGMHKEAIDEMQMAIRLSGGSLVSVAALGYFYARAGRRDEAIRIVNKLKARSKREFVPPQAFIGAYAYLGDKDQALALLEKCYEERTDIVGLKVDPWFDPLRADPRFQDLVRRMKFPE